MQQILDAKPHQNDDTHDQTPYQATKMDPATKVHLEHCPDAGEDSSRSRAVLCKAMLCAECSGQAGTDSSFTHSLYMHLRRIMSQLSTRRSTKLGHLGGNPQVHRCQLSPSRPSRDSSGPWYRVCAARSACEPPSGAAEESPCLLLVSLDQGLVDRQQTQPWYYSCAHMHLPGAWCATASSN